MNWRALCGSPLTSAAWRGYDDVLGMNGRNHLIVQENAPEAIRLVDDKHATKQALAGVGAPAAPTLALVTGRRELAALDWDALPPAWALKPNQSLGGTGILLAAGRHEDGGWRTGSGRRLGLLEVKDHVRLILDGEFSPRGRDCALIEPLIVSHPDLARISFRGLPDVRVICIGDEPRLAMLRLPTSASGGRANLHQHAIGAAVDLATGEVERAWSAGETLTQHPDTGER